MAASRGPGDRALDTSPLVSVVVPVYNAEEHLDDCLRSIRDQSYRNLQVVVIDDGSTDHSSDIYRRHAAEDPRIVLTSQVNAGPGAARNVAIAIATGDYLTFVDSDDTIPKGAYRTFITSLERSGSDFAVGALRNLSKGVFRRPWWIQEVHRFDRIGTTLDEYPDAVLDVIACNRMFRRSFWDRSGLAFPEGTTYEDHLPMMQAYVLATAFDLLTAVTYDWHTRDAGSSLSKRKHELSNLRDRVRVKRATRRWMTEHASPIGLDAWHTRALDTDLYLFTHELPRAEEQYWDLLREAYADLMSTASPRAIEKMRAERRVVAWLAAHGRRSEVEELHRLRAPEHDQLETVVRDGEVYGRFPFFEDDEVGVPDTMFMLTDRQTRLVSSLKRCVALSDGTVELDVWAYIRYVDMSAQPTQISASLVSAEGARQPVPVEQVAEPYLTQAAGSKYHDYSAGHVRMRIDPRAVVWPEDGAGVLHLEVGVDVGGIVREGPIDRVDTTGSAATPVAVPVDDHLVTSRFDKRTGLVLTLSPAPFALASIDPRPGAIAGAITSRGERRPVEVRVSVKSKTLACTPVAADGIFELVLPPSAPPIASLQAVDDTGERHDLVTPDMLQWIADSPDHDYTVARGERAQVQVRSASATPFVESIDIGAEAIVVTGRWVGGVPGPFDLTLESHRLALPSTAFDVDGSRFSASFSCHVDEWGLGALPMPAGTYRLSAVLSDDGADREVPVPVAAGLADQLPDRYFDGVLRMRAQRGAGGQLALQVSAPQSPQESGNFAQHRMREHYRAYDGPVDAEAVFFQCYRGEVATDSQLALHEELRRRASHLRLYWGVLDHSVPLPAGAIPLVIGTEAYFDVLARARYLVNNIDFDRWFAKKPYQSYLQSFHGYPFKTMGLSFWRTKNFTDAQLTAEAERRNQAWDTILTPVPEMNDYYREEYQYDGEILALGYPRNDLLVSAQADGVRADTRRRLGIRDDQTVVIYAPTWRENLVRSAWSAATVDFLDPVEASRELGDDYVLLMRGHGYNSRTDQRTARSARVIDVTDYPQINDLVLASDVAVLDYSSLRFDYALTGKPMLFLVPDLDTYGADTRGFLFPYDGTAPGPYLSTTADVVETLRDLDGVTARHRDAYESFNKTYNYLHDGAAAQRVAQAFFGADLGQ